MFNQSVGSVKDDGMGFSGRTTLYTGKQVQRPCGRNTSSLFNNKLASMFKPVWLKTQEQNRMCLRWGQRVIEITEP